MESKLMEIAAQLVALNKSFEKLIKEFHAQNKETFLGYEEQVYNIGSCGESRISEK